MKGSSHKRVARSEWLIEPVITWLRGRPKRRRRRRRRRDWHVVVYLLRPNAGQNKIDPKLRRFLVRSGGRRSGPLAEKETLRSRCAGPSISDCWTGLLLAHVKVAERLRTCFGVSFSQLPSNSSGDAFVPTPPLAWWTWTPSGNCSKEHLRTGVATPSVPLLLLLRRSNGRNSSDLFGDVGDGLSDWLPRRRLNLRKRGNDGRDSDRVRRRIPPPSSSSDWWSKMIGTAGAAAAGGRGSNPPTYVSKSANCRLSSSSLSWMEPPSCCWPTAKLFKLPPDEENRPLPPPTLELNFLPILLMTAGNWSEIFRLCCLSSVAKREEEEEDDAISVRPTAPKSSKYLEKHLSLDRGERPTGDSCPVVVDEVHNFLTAWLGKPNVMWVFLRTGR